MSFSGASGSASAAPKKKKLTREQARRKADKKAAKIRTVHLDASGNQASVKQKTLKQINKSAEKVSSRFRYASFNQRLQDVHLPPAAISASTTYRPYSGLEAPLASTSTSSAPQLPSYNRYWVDAGVDVGQDQDDDHYDDGDEAASLHARTSFSQALEAWTDLNLSNAFQSLYRQLNHNSRSLPQLIHHRSAISETLSTCLSRTDQWLAWDAALDLLPRLAKDLGSEFLPIYPDSLRSAIHITTTTKAVTDGDERAAAVLVERGFQSAAWILKAVSPLIVSRQPSSRSQNQDDMDVDEEADQNDDKRQRIDSDDIQDPEDDHEEQEVDERTQRLIHTWLVIRPYLGWRAISTDPLANSARETNIEEEAGSDEEDQDRDDQPGLDLAESPKALPSTNDIRLKRISPFTRRFASEAFAHLLRKTRGEQLHNIVHHILQDLMFMLEHEDSLDVYRKHPSRRPSVRFSRGVAGIWVEACKSIDRRLHSKCLPLLDILFTASDPPPSSNSLSSSGINYAHLTRLVVGRLTITALVHHSKSTLFSPVLEHLIQLVEARRGELDSRLDSPQQDVTTSIGLFSHLTESVEWLATAVGVRKGSRVADSTKPALFALLLRLSSLFLNSAVQDQEGAALRTSLIMLFSLALPTGRIQDLIGSGIKLIEAVAPIASATSPSHVVQQRQVLWPEFSGLVEALADPNLEWDGFKQFVLPSVLTSTAETVASDVISSQSKDQAIVLLERLDKLGQLQHLRSTTPSPFLTRWSKLISSEIETRLQKLTDIFCQPDSNGKHLDAARIFSDQASLEPLIPALRLAALPRTPANGKFTTLLLQLVKDGLLADALASAQNLRHLYEQHVINPALLLSLAFNALANLDELNSQRESQVAQKLFTESDTIKRVIKSASWHRGAFSSLSRLASLCGSRRQLRLPDLSQVYDEMVIAVMSADSQVRLASLKILSMIEHSFGDDHVFFDRLAEVEATPLTVTTVRDRNVRLRSVGRDLSRHIAAYKPADASRLRQRDSLIIRYILANLKINLRPIWSESVKALVETANCGSKGICDDLFTAALSEIEAGRQLEGAEIRTVPSSWTSGQGEVGSSKSKLADVDELEPDRILRDDSEMAEVDNDKQFQDGILLARRSSTRRCIQHARISAGARSAHALSTTLADCVDMQNPDARLDVINYRLQILKLLGEISSVVEQHNTPFVQVFLRDAGPRNPAGVLLSPLDVEDGEDDEDGENEPQSSSQDLHKMDLGKKDRQAQLCAYLEVFAKFKNPRALFRAEDLHSYLLSLSASAEISIQKLALDAILTWKDEAITPYSAKLKDLLDAANFRDTLTTFTLSSDSDVVQPYHRPQLMPLVIRLLFGALLSRKGNRTSGAGQKSRRGAVLSALAEIQSEELVTLVDLMLAPFGDQVTERESDNAFAFSPKPPIASMRRQVGFLTLLGEVIKQIGTELLPYWDRLVSATFNLTYHAHQSVLQAHDVDAAIDQEAGKSLSARTSRARMVRQAGYKRIGNFFARPQTVTVFKWDLYLPALFSELISPRLPSLPVESSQNPSALLELFHIWSSQPETIRLLGVYDNHVLPSVFAILESPIVKAPVVSYILDIVERILSAAAMEAQDGPDSIPHLSELKTASRKSIVDLLVKPHASAFLNSVAPLLLSASAAHGATGTAKGGDDLLRRQISILSAFSPYVTKPADASHLIQILTPMMRKSNHLVPEKTKAELLVIFGRLLNLAPEFQDKDSEMFRSTFSMFAALFSALRSNESRKTLSDAFTCFAEIDPSLLRVCSWCSQLNAMSRRRMEERDFDQMFGAFDAINDSGTQIQTQEWHPLVCNMLFFLTDPEELSVRSNASAVLVKFLVQTAAETGQGAEQDHTLMGLFVRSLWPGLKKAIRNKSELVRRDVLAVMSSAVANLSQVPIMAELRGLLADGEAEANFFHNIHHIQIHRRTRAVRRLADQAAKGDMKSKTISDILAPLLGHFLITGSVELNDHNLVTEVISTLGKLAGQMQWGAYNALLWQYLRLANEKGSGERIMVRTAMSILDNFHFHMETEIDEEMDRDDDAEEKDETDLDARKEQESRRVKILDAVTNKLLPALMSYLEQKDETEDATRLPIAVGVVRVAQCLPAKQRHSQLSKLLRTLANILRSKSQETRDLTRETLCKVMASLGPSYLSEMLRELRRSLMRGPQKAVLAFTVHSVLIHLTSSQDNPLTSLDESAKDIIEIAVEDLFGGTAEDRESIGSKTTYKEVKHSKSMDTFEQVARLVSPNRIADLLQPLRDILQQTEMPKTVRQVEECLRRTSSGIAANSQFDSNRFLLLCATLIRRDAGYLQARKPESKAASKNKSASLYNYSVFLKRKEVEEGGAKDHYSRNAHKFVAFGLEMLVVALRRERFDFRDEEVLAKLNSMVNLIGETAYANESSVLELSLRAIGQIVKVPVARVDKALPVFLKQIFNIIHQFGSPQSQIVQTAFRTLATILRECKQSSLSENHLSGLLKLIAPDLEEPSVQSTLFRLLRAIVSRRFVVPEVYDTMDKVAEMLVTNQSQSVRELCSSTYLQFLLDYPQGKQRLKNQMGFLAKNLSYEHESGRLSVLDILEAIFNKFGDEILQEYAEMFFIALAMMLANDISTKCRERSATLIKTLAQSMTSTQQDKTAVMVSAWAKQDAKPELARVGVQIYGILLEALPDRTSDWSSGALEIVTKVLSECADDLESVESLDDMEGVELDWQLPYHSLQTLSRLPNAKSAKVAVDATRRLLLFPHKWVRIAASRLLGSLYASVEPATPEMVSIQQEPLRSFPALVDAAKKMSLQLRSENLDDVLALQIVKNLVWVGRCFALYPVEREPSNGHSAPSHGSPHPQLSDNEETNAEDPEGEADEDSDGEDGGDGGDDDDDDDESLIDNTDQKEAEMDAASSIAADPLKWLIHRLSFQARVCLSRSKGENWVIQPSSILRFLAALASSMQPPSLVAVFLESMLSPVIRIVEANSIDDDELKTLALEVQGLLQGLVPISKFNATYSQIKRKQEAKRQERKTKRLMRGIQNPDAEAARKRSKNLKNHLARKRRNEEHLRKRESGGSGKVKRVRRE